MGDTEEIAEAADAAAEETADTIEEREDTRWTNLFAKLDSIEAKLTPAPEPEPESVTEVDEETEVLEVEEPEPPAAPPARRKGPPKKSLRLWR